MTLSEKYFDGYRDDLCQTCQERLEKNPMRILDCKSDICGKIAAGAPRITEYLCDGCSRHFEALKAALDNIGLRYEIDTSIVRGLDYYTKTVFEFIENSTGLTLLAGGRYDGLINELDGNKNICGLGFASGIERLISAMENAHASFGEDRKCKIFIGYIGEKGAAKAAKTVKYLRDNGVSAETDISGRSLKAQMKYADKIGAENTLILGDDEVDKGSGAIRNMRTGECSEIDLDDILDTVR